MYSSVCASSHSKCLLRHMFTHKPRRREVSLMSFDDCLKWMDVLETTSSEFVISSTTVVITLQPMKSDDWQKDLRSFP